MRRRSASVSAKARRPHDERPWIVLSPFHEQLPLRPQNIGSKSQTESAVGTRVAQVVHGNAQ